MKHPGENAEKPHRNPPLINLSRPRPQVSRLTRQSTLANVVGKAAPQITGPCLQERANQHFDPELHVGNEARNHSASNIETLGLDSDDFNMR
jgi:hypothetical protein